jgi:hypothetical protein
MDFTNVYEDAKRAESYARLEFPGTYYLAYRDIPGIIEKYYTPPQPSPKGREKKLKSFDSDAERDVRHGI